MADPDAFLPFAERMRAEGLPEIVIQTFRYYYAQLERGETGLVCDAEVHPVAGLPDAERLPESLADAGRRALPHTVLIKLNGGLGTGMGLERAKSLLRVKGNLTFLDVVARQALRCRVPLVLMNSYNTHDDSLAALRPYPALSGALPPDFVQYKVPKVRVADLRPIEWPANPALEWCPPGHGEIYGALMTRGMLAKMLAAGYEYAFVSNIDNLGAGMDLRLLGYFVVHNLPFMMEVTDRTDADRKGGPLVRRKADGRYLLWESASCPAEDQGAFQDIRRHCYFNTNNLWLNLAALRTELAAREGILGLPMIRSRKTVDPRDARSAAVYQLETAMGAAISIFKGAEAIRVPRARFAPVKSCDDLLAVRSDAYVLTEDHTIRLDPARYAMPPSIALDPAYYRLVDEMEARFPFGPPSLRGCERLIVRGDVRFGRDVVVTGSVELVNRHQHQIGVKDGTVLTGNYSW